MTDDPSQPSKTPPPGFPGYRNRSDRSGLDYIDTAREYGHMEGKFLRYLFTLRLRTRNPFYLGAMLILGLAALLPMIAVVAELSRYSELLCLGLPIFAFGVALLGNFTINLYRILNVRAENSEDHLVNNTVHRKHTHIRRKIRYPEREK